MATSHQMTTSTNHSSSAARPSLVLSLVNTTISALHHSRPKHL
jgi:hypothetical protein